MLHAGNNQTLSVTFTPTDTTDYTTATADDDDQRQAGHAHDHLAEPGGDHLRHGLGQHAAGRHGQRARALFVYTPASGTVLHAGNNQTLSVTFTPTDTTDYTTATQTTTINVTQATPTITWPTPAAITYGTALGSTQLDATRCPGTFAYTPGRPGPCWPPATARRSR